MPKEGGGSTSGTLSATPAPSASEAPPPPSSGGWCTRWSIVAILLLAALATLGASITQNEDGTLNDPDFSKLPIKHYFNFFVSGCGAGADAGDVYFAGKWPCTRCPKGGMVGVWWLRGYTACQAVPGQYGENGGPFSKCSVGRFKSTYGNAACESCPYGGTTKYRGSKTHKDCLADVGFYGAGFQDFTKCPSPHATTDGKGGETVDACVSIEGAYMVKGANGRATSYKPCAKGSFSESLGAAQCEYCPKHSTTPSSGSASKQACKSMPGYHRVGNSNDIFKAGRNPLP